MTWHGELRDWKIQHAVEYLIYTGNRDALNGGIPSALLAEYIGAGRRAVRSHCIEMANDGKLVHVIGANPENLERRESFLPAGTHTQYGGMDS